MFAGYNTIKGFKRPDGSLSSFGNKCWFTNLRLSRLDIPLDLTKNYEDNEENYPRYDNYPAIECKKVKDIPKDYYDIIGVSLQFILKYCPEQFEIISCTQKNCDYSIILDKDYSKYIGYYQNGRKTGRTGTTFGHDCVIEKDDGIHCYYEFEGRRLQALNQRLFIKRKSLSLSR